MDTNIAVANIKFYINSNRWIHMYKAFILLREQDVVLNKICETWKREVRHWWYQYLFIFVLKIHWDDIIFLKPIRDDIRPSKPTCKREAYGIIHIHKRRALPEKDIRLCNACFIMAKVSQRWFLPQGKLFCSDKGYTCFSHFNFGCGTCEFSRD